MAEQVFESKDDLDEKQYRSPTMGHCQSPIDIESSPKMIRNKKNIAKTGKTKLITKEDFHRYGIKILYPEKVKNCTILNNSHTVQVNIPAQNNCTLTIHNHTYMLRQFHFHTPSEHLINSTQFEMEMHLVHTDEKGAICVLGFIFTTQKHHFLPKLKLSASRHHLTLNFKPKHSKPSKGSSSALDAPIIEEEDSDLATDEEWSSSSEDEAMDKKQKEKQRIFYGGDEPEGNDFLAQFWSQLPQYKTDQDIVLSKPLTFDYLFESAASDFTKNIETNEIQVNMALFEYIGSLTTPPFTEGVQWIVSKKTHFIGSEQLKQLSACWGFQNNARKVQPYHGRLVSLRSIASLK